MIMGSDKLDKDVALPSKLFELLRLSIKHMERLNRDTSYCMDMGVWMQPNDFDHEICDISLSGAIMHNVLGVNADITITTADVYRSKYYKEFLALECLSDFSVVAALETFYPQRFGMDKLSKLDDWETSIYKGFTNNANCIDQWRNEAHDYFRNLRIIADALEKEGY